MITYRVFYSLGEATSNADCFFLLDIDECSERAKGGCHHGCVNTRGSFKCTCRQGYRLVPDGKKCLGKQCNIIVAITC